MSNHHVALDEVKASVCHTDDQDFSSAEVTYRSECVTFCKVKKAITTAIYIATRHRAVDAYYITMGVPHPSIQRLLWHVSSIAVDNAG